MPPLRRTFAIVALALVLAPLAARAPLFDPDEGLHAAIAQEMARSGDFVTPRFLGEPFLDKPILFFWAEAVSLRVFGMNEAAVRIPPLLFGVLGMVAVALLGRTLVGETAGLIAGIVYGTMLLPMGVSEIAVHDVAIVPFMCAAILFFVAAADIPVASGDIPVASGDIPVASGDIPVASGFSRKAAAIVAAGVCLGLSILTKGLVGVAFAGIFAVCLVVARPAALLRLAIALAVAIAIAAIVAAPWYIAMERAHPGYLHYYFIERHLQGYLTATQRHAGRAWWYYVPIVLGGSLPWTGYLVTALQPARLVKPGVGDVGIGRIRAVVCGWFVLGLVFLSLGESKLATYALPLFPALAILVGDAIASSGGTIDRVGYGIYALTLTVLPVAALVWVQFKFGGIQPAYWLVTGLVSAAIAFVAIPRRPRGPRLDVEPDPRDPRGPRHVEPDPRNPRDPRQDVGRDPRGPRLDFTGAAPRLSLMALFGLMMITPRAAAWMTSRDVAAKLNTMGRLPPHVLVVGERVGSIIFYLDPRLRSQATPENIDQAPMVEAIQRSRAEPLDGVVIVRDNLLKRFERQFAVPPVPDSTAGTFTIFRVENLQKALRGAQR